MKLYVNSRGEWVGTQAEAKKINAVQVDVPISKPELLAFLNRERVCRSTATYDVAEKNSSHLLKSEPLPVTVKTSNITKPHAWQTIRECAEHADLKDLGVALAVLMDRLDAAADNVRH